jgi:hypothetical protein
MALVPLEPEEPDDPLLDWSPDEPELVPLVPLEPEEPDDPLLDWSPDEPDDPLLD